MAYGVTDLLYGFSWGELYRGTIRGNYKGELLARLYSTFSKDNLPDEGRIFYGSLLSRTNSI